MGKKIHNPPPPTGMVRPTPPPNPPRVPCWQDDIDEVKRLTAALEQLKGELRIKSEFLSSRQCPDHSGKWQRGDCLQCRIEQLEAALTWIGDGHIDDVTEIMDYARKSSGSAGDSSP